MPRKSAGISPIFCRADRQDSAGGGRACRQSEMVRLKTGGLPAIALMPSMTYSCLASRRRERSADRSERKVVMGNRSRLSDRPDRAGIVARRRRPPARVDIRAPSRALQPHPRRAPRTPAGSPARSGAMYYEWGEACDGWTVDQRFRLRLIYAEEIGTVEINSTLLDLGIERRAANTATTRRRLRNGDVEDDIPWRGASRSARIRAASPSSRKPQATTMEPWRLACSFRQRIRWC